MFEEGSLFLTAPRDLLARWDPRVLPVKNWIRKNSDRF